MLRNKILKQRIQNTKPKKIIVFFLQDRQYLASTDDSMK